MDAARADDPSVADDVVLYRRVHPDFLVVDDNHGGCVRLTSGAFQQDEMSVALGDDLERVNRRFVSLLDGYDGYALVGFPAVTARSVGQAVCRDHLPTDDAHGLVIGKKRAPVKRALARDSVWAVPPLGACEPPYE